MLHSLFILNIHGCVRFSSHGLQHAFGLSRSIDGAVGGFGFGRSVRWRMRQPQTACIAWRLHRPYASRANSTTVWDRFDDTFPHPYTPTYTHA